MGGLRNALDRGEPLAKAKQSFLNAGYKPAEIEGAVQKMPTADSQINNQVRDSREDKVLVPAAKKQLATIEGIKPLPTTTTEQIPGQPQKLSKRFIIILISSAALVLVGAALLGIFWDKFFG